MRRKTWSCRITVGKRCPSVKSTFLFFIFFSFSRDTCMNTRWLEVSLAVLSVTNDRDRQGLKLCSTDASLTRGFCLSFLAWKSYVAQRYITGCCAVFLDLVKKFFLKSIVGAFPYLPYRSNLGRIEIDALRDNRGKSKGEGVFIFFFVFVAFYGQIVNLLALICRRR